MYNYQGIKSLAKFYTSIIEIDESINKENDVIFDYILDFKAYCKSLIEIDNQTDKIFGYYGLYSNINSISKIANISTELVKETIVFRYTTDEYLSMIIKEMFCMSNYGGVYNPFLRYQIQSIARSGSFAEYNMRNEFIKFNHFQIKQKRNYDYSPFPKILLKNGETFDTIGFSFDGSYFMPELDD